MGDLSHRDILSVLDRLDLEFTQTLQAKTALQHVRAILVEFEAAKQGLAAQAQTRDAMAGEIAALRTKYAQEESAQKAALNEHLAPIHRAIAEANDAHATAKARLSEISGIVANEEADRQTRLGELDGQIKAQQEHLASLTEALAQLKRTHRL